MRSFQATFLFIFKTCYINVKVIVKYQFQIFLHVSFVANVGSTMVSVEIAPERILEWLS